MANTFLVQFVDDDDDEPLGLVARLHHARAIGDAWSYQLSTRDNFRSEIVRDADGGTHSEVKLNRASMSLKPLSLRNLPFNLDLTPMEAEIMIGHHNKIITEKTRTCSLHMSIT